MEVDDDEPSTPGFTPGSLQAQLEDTLKTLNALIVPSEPVQNDGKTLVIRYAVWLLDLDLLPTKLPNAWRLLEVATFSEVYAEKDPSGLVDQAIILKRNELIVASDTEEPLAYRYCPRCASPNLHRTSHTLKDDMIYYIWCDCGWAETS